MAYLNVYQSGYYHRRGKPGQYNCHPGDLYPTFIAAQMDVDPNARHLYLGTFEVNIPAEVLGAANPVDCVPLPLSQTRRELRVPSHIEGMRPLVKAVADWPLEGSLETTSDEAVDVEPPNLVAFREAMLRDAGLPSRFGEGEEGR